MISSFKNRATEDLFHGLGTSRARRFPPDVVRAALRKLDMLEAAHQLDDLRSVPGNRLHRLKGERKDYYGISVNDQWRVIFRWGGHDASDVSLTDYH